MEAKELRIGNIVSHGKYDIVVRIVCFYGISRIQVDSAYFNSATDDQCDIDLLECKPIPLTEEWLLKFGFSLKSYEYYHPSFHIGIQKRDNEYRLYQGHNCIDIKITSVHQLQNLFFALTGVEIQAINQ